MSVERSILVAVPRTPELGKLVEDIVSAAERAEHAEPGDRADIIRYEALSVRLEAAAHAALSGGAASCAPPEPLPDSAGYAFEDPAVAKRGDRLAVRLPPAAADFARAHVGQATVVELRLPFSEGVAEAAGRHRAAGPAETWRAQDDATGSRAVEQRFRAQLSGVIARLSAGGGPARDDAISPSGVHNRVLTQVLREQVIGSPAQRLDVPVTYRDGSQSAHPFPLRCLPLAPALPSVPADLALHLALLSIRHAEMDPVVDGAWLRNAEVSRPRPAASTDDFVFETSVTQLRELTDDGARRVCLHIYQTGLDTAVVGFYRGVVAFLLERPYAVSVVPMFYASGSSANGLSETARFRPGKPWTLGNPR